jgi:vacuolar-type H+-ATPase subunit H
MPNDAPDKDTAIATAVAEATKEVEGTTVPETPQKPETPSEEPEPEAEPDKAAPKAEPPAADEADEEVFTPTAEELALIDKSPELKKVYRSMQRGLTQKSQKLAADRKAHQEEVEIATWIRLNPKDAAKAMAQATGLTVSEASTVVAAAKAETAQTLDELTEEWNKAVGPEPAKILRALVEKTAERIAEKKIEPYKGQAEQLMRDANNRGISASMREFGASIVEAGGDFSDEIQAEMSEIADLIDPKEDTTINDYLATLHDVALTRMNRKAVAKESLRRLRGIRSEAEPASTTRPAPKAEPSITNSMSDREAVALAVKMAENEMRR